MKNLWSLPADSDALNSNIDARIHRLRSQFRRLGSCPSVSGSTGMVQGRRTWQTAADAANGALTRGPEPVPDLSTAIAEVGVIPLIAAESPDEGVAIARALAAAGPRVLEVVQRTDASLACLEAIARECRGSIVGAGTVLSREQADACVARGARFIVSPGLDADVVAAARSQGVDVFPGVMTPTELQRALKLGLGIVKFFPAETAGGVAAVRALAAVFRELRFIPTGGVSAANLAAYLAQPAVLACAGSWMTPRSAIAAGDYGRVTALASEALAIARSARTRGAQ
jgi:2-dehydro-3-deoxyphosphogluconate aldolase/(4S)-4-hydroxy-2-oxoglutarate aldolase